MTDINVEFIFEGYPVIIYCRKDDKMKDIINKFSIKASVKRDSIYCLYSGKLIDENITIKQLKNSKKKDEKISILVYSVNKDNQENSKSLAKASQVICPKCGEIALISFKDYKIFISCKNNHKTENIFLKDFDNTQKIDESKILCQECKSINKNISFNKQFFICLNCKKNLCPLCKSNHNNNHNIIDYNQKNYICPEHYDSYSLYCKTCKKNLCLACENEHIYHETISFGKLFPNQNDLNNKMNELKNTIIKFKDEIKKIKEILDKICENMDLIYNINDYIYSSFNVKKKNFEILNNIGEIKINNILRDINEIIKLENICFKFNNIFDIYTKMTSKENGNYININLGMNSNTMSNMQNNFNFGMNPNSMTNKINNLNIGIDSVALSNMQNNYNLGKNSNNKINNYNLGMNPNSISNLQNNLNFELNPNRMPNKKNNLNFELNPNSMPNKINNYNLGMNPNSISNKKNNFNDSFFNNRLNNSEKSINQRLILNQKIYQRKHYKIELDGEIKPIIENGSNIIETNEKKEINNIIKLAYTYMVNQKGDSSFLSEIICNKIEQKIHGKWLVFVSDYDKDIPLGFSTIPESDFLIIKLGKTKFQIVKIK